MSNVCESAVVIVVWHIKAYHCAVPCQCSAACCSTKFITRNGLCVHQRHSRFILMVLYHYIEYFNQPASDENRKRGENHFIDNFFFETFNKLNHFLHEHFKSCPRKTRTFKRNQKVIESLSGWVKQEVYSSQITSKRFLKFNVQIGLFRFSLDFPCLFQVFFAETNLAVFRANATISVGHNVVVMSPSDDRVHQCSI